MRYTPHTASDKEQMLRTIGLSRIEQLFDHIPQSLRERAAISLPSGLTEVKVKKRMAALAAKNATPEDWTFFLGGGIYDHFVPAAVSAVTTMPS